MTRVEHWESKALGKRRLGKPGKTRHNAVGKILKKMGTTWLEAKKLAQDKKK